MTRCRGGAPWPPTRRIPGSCRAVGPAAGGRRYTVRTGAGGAAQQAGSDGYFCQPFGAQATGSEDEAGRPSATGPVSDAQVAGAAHGRRSELQPGSMVLLDRWAGAETLAADLGRV